MRSVSPLALAALGALTGVACVSDRTLSPAAEPTAVGTTFNGQLAVASAATKDFIVISNGKSSAAQVQALGALGAEVTGSLDELGLVFAKSSDPEFAAKRGRSKRSTRPRPRARSSSASTRWDRSRPRASRAPR